MVDCPTLTVTPLGFLARAADYAMHPVMQILMELNGTPYESPQLTHRWNNHHLMRCDVAHLNRALMVCRPGIPDERWFGGIFRHMSIIGWRYYIVVEPTASAPWYPGWITKDAIGVSRIPQCGKTRLLLGPGEVQFFGIDVQTGRQLQLLTAGEGRLGDNTGNERLPLV